MIAKKYPIKRIFQNEIMEAPCMIRSTRTHHRESFEKFDMWLKKCFNGWSWVKTGGGIGSWRRPLYSFINSVTGHQNFLNDELCNCPPKTESLKINFTLGQDPLRRVGQNFAWKMATMPIESWRVTACCVYRFCFGEVLDPIIPGQNWRDLAQ